MLLLLAGPAARARAADEVGSSIEALSSPAERERAAARARLLALLPDARARLVEGLTNAAPEVQAEIARVLAEDGSPEAVQALLAHLDAASDELALSIARSVVRDETASRIARETLRAAAESAREPTARERRLLAMLDRAEVERLFLSRKSSTGSTGTYRGQFAILLPYREAALEMVLDMLVDRARAEPGVVRAGPFEFVRPPRFTWDIGEIQDMAANALIEVARPDDLEAKAELDALLRRVHDETEHSLYRSISTQSDRDWIEFTYGVGRYADLIVAAYRIWPDDYDDRLEDFLYRLGHSWKTQASETLYPAVLLRVGRYREAIGLYEDLLQWPDPDGSGAMTHYNLACAYAQWGEVQKSDATKMQYRARSLWHLEKAVDARWSDLGWLDEDRDLDPIRDTSRFKELRARVLEEITPPDERARAPGSTPGSGR